MATSMTISSGVPMTYDLADLAEKTEQEALPAVSDPGRPSAREVIERQLAQLREFKVPINEEIRRLEDLVGLIPEDLDGPAEQALYKMAKEYRKEVDRLMGKAGTSFTEPEHFPGGSTSINPWVFKPLQYYPPVPVGGNPSTATGATGGYSGISITANGIDQFLTGNSIDFSGTFTADSIAKATFDLKKNPPIYCSWTDINTIDSGDDSGVEP
jgi:hypothetical protein